MPTIRSLQKDHNHPEKGIDPRFEDWIAGIRLALERAQGGLESLPTGHPNFVIPKAVLELRVRVNAVKRTDDEGGVDLIVWSNKGSNTTSSEEEFTSTVRLEFVNLGAMLEG